MGENNIDINQIKEEIKKIKLEIIQKENEIDSLLKIINNEPDTDSNYEQEN